MSGIYFLKKIIESFNQILNVFSPEFTSSLNQIPNMTGASS